MNDDVLTRNENEELAVRVVSANESSTVVNPNDVYTRDENGNLAIRTVGGSGGDSHNKGYYATPEALRTAYPTAEAGDFAIVESTDTIWIWDSDTSAWKDSDQKGEVTPDMVIIKSLTMPTASTIPAGAVYQYIGQTNTNYTHGYIYENIKTATYTGTVSFEPASLSGTTVACSGDDFANFLTESGVSPLSVVSGTMTYDAAGSLWVLVGKDENDETVLTFQEYQEDYEDFGFTFTGTPQDSDVIAFTCTVEEASASYAWTRIDVQPMPEIPDPLPSQTGNANKFLITDGTNTSWSDRIPSLQLRGANVWTGGVLTIYGNGNNRIEFTSYSSGTQGIMYAMSGGGLQFVISGADYRMLSSSFVSANTNVTLGSSTYKWSSLYATKINNGADINVPTTGGTLALTSDLPSSPATMPELTVAGWSSNTQTVTVTGVTATNTVFVSPAPASASDYASAGIICTAQGTDSLTFTCTTVPSNAITVNVVIMG